MKNKKKHDVLALNRSFIPVHVMDWKKAFKNMVNGTVRALDRDFVAYDFEDWLLFSELADDYAKVRTVSHKIAVPEIVVEKDFNKIPRRDVKYSRQTLFERDGFKCAYCLKKFGRRELTVDHVVPRCMGGRTTWQNTVSSCKPCNARKADKTPEQAGMKLRKKPAKPKWVSPLSGIGRSHPCKSWYRFLDKTLVDIGEEDAKEEK